MSGEPCFPECWKIQVSSVIPVFTNVGKGLQLKTIDLLDFSVVSKVFISQVSLSVAYLTVANLARLGILVQC